MHHDSRSTLFVLLEPQASEVPHKHLVQHAAVVDGAFQEALVVVEGQLQVEKVAQLAVLVVLLEHTAAGGLLAVDLRSWVVPVDSCEQLF